MRAASNRGPGPWLLPERHHRKQRRRQPDLRAERFILVREGVALDLAYPTAMILAAESTPIPRALLNTRG